MIRLLADENVPRSLVRALRQAEPGIDLVTVYEIQYAGRSDPEILEWASGEGRFVLTLDHQTMPGFVRDRVSAGLPTTGIILVHTGCSLQTLVEDLHIIVCCAKEEELSRIHVQHVPLS